MTSRQVLIWGAIVSTPLAIVGAWPGQRIIPPGAHTLAVGAAAACIAALAAQRHHARAQAATADQADAYARALFVAGKCIGAREAQEQPPHAS